MGKSDWVVAVGSGGESVGVAVSVGSGVSVGWGVGEGSSVGVGVLVGVGVTVGAIFRKVILRSAYVLRVLVR